MEKLLVIQSVKSPMTNEVVATKMFITEDEDYLQYKAKPNIAFPLLDENKVDIGVRVYYKIKRLGVNKANIAKVRRAISRYNKLK